MKTKNLLLLSIFTAFTLQANECVCFELKGEFGEEIKELLKKYTKNLGDKDIKIVKEDSDLPKNESFLDSLVGIGSLSGGGSDEVEVTERAKNLYRVQCSSCHGDSGEKEINGVSIDSLSKKEIADALFSYQDEEYKGAARFVKQTAARSMSSSDMESLAAYISKKEEPKK